MNRSEKMGFFMPTNGHCRNLDTEYLSNLIMSTTLCLFYEYAHA